MSDGDMNKTRKVHVHFGYSPSGRRAKARYGVVVYNEVEKREGQKHEDTGD